MTTKKVIQKYLKPFLQLTIEEKILNAGLLLSIIATFLPWLTLNSQIEAKTYNAFGFDTSTVGLTICILLIFSLLITIIPLTIKKHLLPSLIKNKIRFHITINCCVLLLAVLSIYTNMTWESPQISIRFGIYLCLIGSFLAAVYSWLTIKNKDSCFIKDVKEPDNEKQKSDGMYTIPVAPVAESHNPLRKN